MLELKLGTKLHLKQKILNFGPNFLKKGIQNWPNECHCRIQHI